MWNKVLLTGLIVCLSAGLAGCYPNSPNQNVGTAIGAVAGGLVGSAIGAGTGQAVAIGVGAVAGALIGGAIGQQMDENDRMRTAAAIRYGQRTYWVNEKTGRAYEVVPVGRIWVSGYRHCRRYYTVMTMDGRKTRVYGTACRMMDGTWRAM